MNTDIFEFIKSFVEVVEIEDPATVTPETNFRDLDEWSSISTLSVIALADEEYGVELNPDVFRKAKTIEDLFNAIKSLM